jgi:hypothetical protein
MTVVCAGRLVIPVGPGPAGGGLGCGAPLLHRFPGDRLLRRSFQAGGQPAPTQVKDRSRCPWVTVGGRSFPPVLARTWHASLCAGTEFGIIGTWR